MTYIRREEEEEEEMRIAQFGIFWLFCFILFIFYFIQSHLHKQRNLKLFQMRGAGWGGEGGCWPMLCGRLTGDDGWWLRWCVILIHAIKGNFYILSTQTHTRTVHTEDSVWGLFIAAGDERWNVSLFMILSHCDWRLCVCLCVFVWRRGGLHCTWSLLLLSAVVSLKGSVSETMNEWEGKCVIFFSPLLHWM